MSVVIRGSHRQVPAHVPLHVYLTRLPRAIRILNDLERVLNVVPGGHGARRTSPEPGRIIERHRPWGCLRRLFRDTDFVSIALLNEWDYSQDPLLSVEVVSIL